MPCARANIGGPASQPTRTSDTRDGNTDAKQRSKIDTPHVPSARSQNVARLCGEYDDASRRITTETQTVVRRRQRGGTLGHYLQLETARAIQSETPTAPSTAMLSNARERLWGKAMPPGRVGPRV